MYICIYINGKIMKMLIIIGFYNSRIIIRMDVF